MLNEGHCGKNKKRPDTMNTYDMEELDPPPAYEEITQPLAIPKLDLNRSVGSPRTSTVTKDECVAHLKFLATLADLRETISVQDGLFGIWDREADDARVGRQNMLARIREKRWAVYTSRAVDRYWTWWVRCVPNSRAPARVNTLQSPTYVNITRAPAYRLDRVFMPPLGEFFFFFFCRHGSILYMSD